MSLHNAYLNLPVGVLGGGGFIGGEVAAQLQQAGACVYSIGGLGAAPTVPKKLRGRITSDLIQLIPDRPAVLFHLAGGASVARSVENPMHEFDLTVQGTLEVLEYIRTRNPNCRLVYVSSAAVYGDTGGTMAENSAMRPASPYGMHKLLAEQQCIFYARAYDLKVTIVRPFSVYGPGLRKQLLWDALNKADQGICTFWGSGAEVRDWVYVADLARLLLQVGCERIRSPSTQPIDAGTGIGTSVKEVLTRLLALYKPEAKPQFLGSERSGDPHELVAHRVRPEVSEILGEVGLDEGLSRYVAWYRQRDLPC